MNILKLKNYREINEIKRLLPVNISLKEIFLNKLRGKNKKYKRYLGSPLRYAGGKSWAVGYIIEHFPDNIKRLISPFFGGGSVEIAAAKDLRIVLIFW